MSRTTLKPLGLDSSFWIACGDVADAVTNLRLLDAEFEGLARHAQEFLDGQERSGRPEP